MQNNYAYFYLRKCVFYNHGRSQSYHRVGAIFLRRARPIGGCYATYAVVGDGDTFSRSYAWQLTQERMLNGHGKFFSDSFLTVGSDVRLSSEHLADFLAGFDVERLKHFDINTLQYSAASFAGALLHLGYRQKEIVCPDSTSPSAT
jgi:hypothetical protein